MHRPAVSRTVVRPPVQGPRSDQVHAVDCVTVTQSTANGAAGQASPQATTRRCRWCGRPFDVVAGPGRPREYCRRSCRQRDYEARRRSAELGLGDGQLVVARAELDALHDRLYELEAAIEDVERDLAATDPPGLADYREAIDWLLAVARPLTSLRVGERGG